METALLILLIVTLCAAVAAVALLVLLLRRMKELDADKLTDAISDEVTERSGLLLYNVKNELLRENRESRGETGQAVQTTMRAVSETLTGSVNEQLRTFSAQNAAALGAIRDTMEGRLDALRRENGEQLGKIQQTVDEKLQQTLNERISQSFQTVSERLEAVYAGLGEVRALAGGVGDLKRVLSNVKTRGILGEYQLGAILEEILSPEQYAANVATKPGSDNRVEYAIRLPGEAGEGVWLPVDAKFPGDSYEAVLDAEEAADPARLAEARAVLTARLKAEAKDVHDKYIDPPHTTEFAILFLPFEGLYAEAVRLGMVELLQRAYRVNLAGPTTFAALLNSLQMGFRTLAIQKRSGEVWKLLGAVKTEFETFEDVLTAAQRRIEQTGAELDKLVGVRTRKINSRLRNVTALPAEESARTLEE